MDKSDPQTPTEKGSGHCAANDAPSPFLTPSESSSCINSFRELSTTWKPLVECAGSSDVPGKSTIFVPDPSPTKTLLDSDGDTPRSETLRGSLSRRRRHGEYHHRPPVWNIRPLVEGSHVRHDEAYSDHADSNPGPTWDDGFSSGSHPQPDGVRPRAIGEPNMLPASAMCDNMFPPLEESFFDAELEAMASSWSNEPLIVGVVGTDSEDSGSDGCWSIRWADATDVVVPDEPLAFTDGSPSSRRSTTPSPNPSLIPLRHFPSRSTHPPNRPADPLQSHRQAGFTSPASDPRVLYGSDEAGPSRPVDINGRYFGKNEPVQREEKEASAHFLIVKAPSLSPVIEQPQDENSTTKELEETRGHSECHEICPVPSTRQQPQYDNQSLSRQGGRPGDSDNVEISLPNQHAKESRGCYQLSSEQQEEHGHFKNIQSSPTTSRLHRPQSGKTPSRGPTGSATGSNQQPTPFLQEITKSKYLTFYRDIRCLPSKRVVGYPFGASRKNGWAILTGSRVICVGDTLVDMADLDNFPIRLGDAYIVLRIYSDFWASCLKLTLENQTWASYPRYDRHMDRRESVFASTEDNIGFLPLCALTLDANFGDYLARHPRTTRGSGDLPATGQKVVAPKRTVSLPLVFNHGPVVVPKAILRQAKYQPMPQDKPAIEELHFKSIHVGHVFAYRPSQMINCDPDMSPFRERRNITRLVGKIEKGMHGGQKSIRDVGERIQESSATFGKFIGGHIRRKFSYSDPMPSGKRRRFFSNNRTSNEGEAQKVTADATNASEQTKDVDENTRERRASVSHASQNTTGAEGSKKPVGQSPQQITSNIQPLGRIRIRRIVPPFD
ncbi:hypothetical protein PABG_00604 [Paracoccidioides brasiliensis Pb03]|nr:hypothetical protein PABG_00604 [Paracoccidioides brasiliensis Pb03]